MALKERTCINEILLRLFPDGSLQGAHVREESQIYDDKTGIVRQSTLGEPQPLEKAASGGIDLDALLGATAGTTLLQVESLTGQVTELQGELALQKQNAETRAGQLDATAKQLATEQADLQALQVATSLQYADDQAHIAALQDAALRLRQAIDAAGVVLPADLDALTRIPDPSPAPAPASEPESKPAE